MGCASSAPKEPEPPPPPPAARQRRGSAAAQGGIDPSKINLRSLPKVLKDEEAVGRIRTCVAKNTLMTHLSEEYKQTVIDSMKEIKASAGEKVITQGELVRARFGRGPSARLPFTRRCGRCAQGDLWFVVEKGALETWKKYEGEDAPKMVKAYAVGDSFGELALMFNQRRAASVVAKEDCVLWAVDQATFRAVMCVPRPP